MRGKEVREAAPDGEGKRARRRNKKARDFTHFLIHKSTLQSIVPSFGLKTCTCTAKEEQLLLLHFRS